MPDSILPSFPLRPRREEEDKEQKVDQERFKKLLKVEGTDEAPKKRKRKRKGEEIEEEAIKKPSDPPPPSPGFAGLMESHHKETILDKQSGGVRYRKETENEPALPLPPSIYAVPGSHTLPPTTPKWESVSPISPPEEPKTSPSTSLSNQSLPPPSTSLFSQDPSPPSTSLFSQSPPPPSTLSFSFNQNPSLQPPSPPPTDHRNVISQPRGAAPHISQFEESDVSAEKVESRVDDQSKTKRFSKKKLNLSKKKGHGLTLLFRKACARLKKKDKIPSAETTSPLEFPLSALQREEALPIPLPEKESPPSMLVKKKAQFFHFFSPQEQRSIKKEAQTTKKTGPSPAHREDFLEATRGNSAIPLPSVAEPFTALVAPCQAANPILFPPEVLEILEQFMAMITMREDSMKSSIVITITTPHSIFYGSQLVLDRFTTSPNALNLKLLSNQPEAIALFESHLSSLSQSLSQSCPHLDINILKPSFHTRTASTQKRKARVHRKELQDDDHQEE